jgi:hypothetical protein
MTNKYKSLFWLLCSLIAVFITYFYFNELLRFLMKFTSHRFESEPVLLSFNDYARNSNILMHGGFGIFCLFFLTSIQYFLMHLANVKNKPINFSRWTIRILKTFSILICIYVVFKNLRGEIISFLTYTTILLFLGSLCVIVLCAMLDLIKRANSR